MSGVVMQQMMQVQVPAGIGPGMPFMVSGADGSQFQVQCPPDAKEGMMISVATPSPQPAVVMAQPVGVQPVGFGQQMAQMNVPPGNTFLLGIHGLYVRQALEVVEMLTDCETKNRYSFTPIPLGTPIPAAPDSSWSKEYRSAAGFNPLLKGKEESECFERVCCPLFRGFKMDLVDGNGTPFITFDRPFKCDPCYSPGCFTCTTQEMSVSAGGAMIANAKMVTGPCCTSGCCNNKFEVYNASGAIIYTMEVNDCSSKTGGSNCLAPSCCNEALTVDVTDSMGNLLPPQTFVFPGCNCGGLNDLTNMVVVFPDNSSADDRSALLLGMMLIEFTIMELRRQQNKDNGGGSGGQPPKGKEMER